MIQIKKAHNGYIVESTVGTTMVFLTIDDLLNDLLLRFEGLAKTFSGKSRGGVIVWRENEFCDHGYNGLCPECDAKLLARMIPSEVKSD